MPDVKVILELGQNISVLMLLVFVASHIFYSFKRPLRPSDQISLGLIFAFIAFVGMLIPVEYSKEVFIDGRVIIVAIAGIFGGPAVGITAGLPVCIYRMFLGGAGAHAGVLEIVFSVLVGVVMCKFLRGRPPRVWHYIAVGILVTAGSILSGFALPPEIFHHALRTHAMAMVVFYPVGTVFIGMLFSIEGAKQEAMLKSRYNEEKYMEMLKNLSEGFFNVAMDSTILDHNLALSRILGFDDNTSLKGRKTVDFFENPRHRERYLAQLERDGEVRDYILKTLRADSRPMTCRLNSRLIRDKNGKPLRIEGTIFDITEQIKTQKELHEARAMLAAAMDQSPVGIAIADAPDGKLRYVNEAGIRIGGRSKAELVDGVSIDEYATRWQVFDLNGQKMDKYSLPLTRAIESGIQGGKEMVIRRPDGDSRRILFNAAPIRDENSKIIAGIAVFMDITDLRAAEESLLEKDEFLRTTYIAAENVAFISTVFQGDDRVVSDFSPGAEKMFGYTKKEILGKSVALLYPEGMANQIRNIQKVLSEGRFFSSSQTELLRKSGENFPVLFSVYPRFDSRGKVIGSLGVVLDISLEKEMERKLRHSEKMEAIGQLAGGIAHDFNNMLGVIKGYADLLIASLGNDEHKEYARNINRAANRSSSLTAQLLAFARKGQYQPSALDFHHIVSETVTMLEHTINKNVEIHQIFKADPATVKGDSNQLINALLNMAINASDAMPEGGMLTFATDTLDLAEKDCPANSELSPGRHLEVLVSDTGKGMTEEVQKHIFEPFFTTKPKGKGTGMGLAAVYGIVKLHSGDITVKSSPGEGSTFRILIPLSFDLAESERSVSKETGLSRKTSRKKQTVLVVDDEKLFRKLAEDLLVKLGYNVLTSSSGKEAIEIYRKSWRKIDLVLLDMLMPGINGKEAFRAMKQVNPAIKAIVASGFSTDADAKEVLEEGIVAFIEKPFAAADFKKTLSKAFLEGSPRAARQGKTGADKQL
ncbi:MAG: PAS domain S-box protein [Victivallales bacterium]|nr:PAS domain S-box protein [Victivallales bacterium]